MPKFKHNYLIFDEFGLAKVLCMCCASPIKSRVEVRSSSDSKVIMREIAKHPEYREIPAVLTDGKLAFLMFCDNCKSVVIGEQEAKDVTEQLKMALRSQLEFEGKLPDLIEEILKVKNYNVSRRAEVKEVTSALKGG